MVLDFDIWLPGQQLISDGTRPKYYKDMAHEFGRMCGVPVSYMTYYSGDPSRVGTMVQTLEFISKILDGQLIDVFYH